MLPAYQAQLKEQAAANAGLTGIFNSLVAASADSAASAALAGSNANRSSDEMGIPSIETMLKLFVPHIESLTRCKQLVPTNVL